MTDTGPTISTVTEDITQLRVDAIVNAANSTLLGGGGVDGAIHRAAGPDLLEECRTLEGCATGEAKITNGYRLPAKYVIHTVGPVWHGGQDNEAELLRACYENALQLCDQYNVQAVAFPAISTGVYGYPKDLACAIAVDVVQAWRRANPAEVYFVCFDRDTLAFYEALLRQA